MPGNARQQKRIHQEACLSEKQYVVYLSPERKDRFRYYHRLESGKIVRFSIQYEALFGKEWRPIARYDTAHGQPHRDLLHPDGSQEKRIFRGYSLNEVLILGERDIKANWRQYRASYEKEMKS